MNEIRITPQFSVITGFQDGIAFKYVPLDFLVSISWESLETIREGLEEKLKWTITDRSLSVDGNQDKVIVTFWTEPPLKAPEQIILEHDNLDRFLQIFKEEA